LVVKERPILFSAPMVRAILDGRKTMTRRVIRPVQPRADGMWPAGRDPVPDCPHGRPGDRLWVRETWGPCDHMNNGGYDLDPPEDIAYRADESALILRSDGSRFRADCRSWNWDKIKWRPSIFMRREYSRITLDVTAIRVERLQDITPEDAEAEGAWRSRNPALTSIDPPEFSTLWDSINGDRPGCSWDANPWVWCVSFRRVESQKAAAE
jgi:hypothetical protein